jgi:hypothetical protein
MQPSIDKPYEWHVAPARGLLESEPSIVALLNPDIEPILLERFLIQFSAWGVQMTRPVEGWIRRAGERCTELGFNDLGRSLVIHSKHEAGHERMLMDDTRQLVEAWNNRRAPLLSADELMLQAPSPAIESYVRLHEDTIASDTPYAQVAIELEIERMSITFGPRLIAQCKRALEPEVLQGLSFIKEHVEVDVGHTALNQRLLERLLKLRPDAAIRLAAIGSEALRTYIRFFGECLVAARAALVH